MSYAGSYNIFSSVPHFFKNQVYLNEVPLFYGFSLRKFSPNILSNIKYCLLLNATFFSFSFPPLLSSCPFSLLPTFHSKRCLSLSFLFSFVVPEHRCLKMQQSSIVCCQDHNYGAPPPPTPPASPLSQTIFSHTERNGTLGRSRPCFPTDEPDNSADSESSSEEEVVEGAVPPPWCQCRLMQDGFLIKCENCRWVICISDISFQIVLCFSGICKLQAFFHQNYVHFFFF